LAGDGPFQDGQAGRVLDTEIELTDGCYEIDLYDSFGDGICCDYGDGSLAILARDGTVLAESDGRFGTYDLIQFCIDNGRARIVHRDRDNKRANRGKKE